MTGGEGETQTLIEVDGLLHLCGGQANVLQAVRVSRYVYRICGAVLGNESNLSGAVALLAVTHFAIAFLALTLLALALLGTICGLGAGCGVAGASFLGTVGLVGAASFSLFAVGCFLTLACFLGTLFLALGTFLVGGLLLAARHGREHGHSKNQKFLHNFSLC
jgi:hypothetical protein